MNRTCCGFFFKVIGDAENWKYFCLYDGVITTMKTKAKICPNCHRKITGTTKRKPLPIYQETKTYTIIDKKKYELDSSSILSQKEV